MKQYKLTLTMSDSFQTGECYSCPLSFWDYLGIQDWRCVMVYRPCDCPLREGQAIEEEYTD